MTGVEGLALARVLHVLGVVVWIGGVWMATTVALPAVRRGALGPDRLAAFQAIERRFVWQARIWVLLAGASGVWMTESGGLWDRFSDPAFWWMHAMVAVWLVFFAMLFVIEPLVLQRRMTASSQPEQDFDRMERMHRVVLALALTAVIGAAAGSRGLL